MPASPTSVRAEQHEVRERMRALGLGYREIAAEFARRYRLRPRAAWRTAYGWTLKQAATHINTHTGDIGLDPGGIASMTASHLCEYEAWPGPAPKHAGRKPDGRRPTPYLLALLARVYNCTVHDLLDLADYEHLPPADRLVLDTYSGHTPQPPRPRHTSNPSAADHPATAKPQTQPRHQTAARPAQPTPAAPGAGVDATSALVTPEPPAVAGDEASMRRRDFTAMAGTALLTALDRHQLGPRDLIGHAGDRLLTYDRLTDEPGTRLRPPSQLRALIDTAKSNYQACRYRAVAASLPQLVADAELASENFRGDSAQLVRALLAEAYHLAASLLLKTGDRGLACVMADRSMQAAHASGDILALGSSARILTHALFATGHSAHAANLAKAMATQIAAKTSLATPAELSVYGSLLLRGAIAAAHDDNRSAALELLAEAAETSARLGTDANHYWTAFGPANVMLHQVNIAITLGDAGAALVYAGKINPERIAAAERRASFWIDVARARVQRRHLEQALAALLTAEECAPEEVRARPAVRALVTDLRAHDHRRSLAGLGEFAARIGTPIP